MTNWYYLPTSNNNSGFALPDGYSAYIAEGVLVTVQGMAQTVLFSGFSNTEIRVEGTIAGWECIQLGNDATAANNETVTVSSSGKVFANDTAIEIVAKNSTVHNDGSVIADDIGIALGGTLVGTLSEVDNTGSIDGGTYGIKIGTGAEAINVVNSGSIKGTTSSYETAGNAADNIVNTGTMTGQIILGDGDDFYIGTKGHLLGSALGGEGSDQLVGGTENNEFYGQAGSDILIGNGGADSLSGGLDADTFIYKKTSDSTVKVSGRDVIDNFLHAEGDIVNLHAIDADTATKGNQDFQLIGKTAFSHHAGELRYEMNAGHTTLFGDVNGDGKADFSIDFDTTVHFKGADFVF